jgi:hypothetical protein
MAREKKYPKKVNRNQFGLLELKGSSGRMKFFGTRKDAAKFIRRLRGISRAKKR